MEQTSQAENKDTVNPPNPKDTDPTQQDSEANTEAQAGDAALTKKQKENLKKKQKKKQKKTQTKDDEDDEEEEKVQEQPEKQPEPAEQQPKEPTEGTEGQVPEASAEPVSDFQNELNWCIKQIRLGLTQNQVNKDQLRESMEVLSVLESTKASLVKKRHLMKVVFGDYRSLMKSAK